MPLLIGYAKKIMLLIRDKKYPIIIEGNGLPILSIGLGILGQRTLSDSFKKQFKLNATSLYWDDQYRLDNPRMLTINQIIDDIAQLGNNLSLQQFFIFAHSAFGIVALEFAKKYSDRVGKAPVK